MNGQSLCPKGAETSRVPQKSGGEQGKGKALLGRSSLSSAWGRDGCTVSVATTFLPLPQSSCAVLRSHLKAPRIRLLEASLSQHNLISEHLMMQPCNVLFAVFFFPGVRFSKPDGNRTCCWQLGCKISCYIKRGEW